MNSSELNSGNQRELASDKPPIGKSWAMIYSTLIAINVLVIILFILFEKSYS